MCKGRQIADAKVYCILNHIFILAVKFLEEHCVLVEICPTTYLEHTGKDIALRMMHPSSHQPLATNLMERNAESCSSIIF